MVTNQELIAGNLHMLSIEEIEPAKTYRCRLCKSTWQYRALPNWWRCPTPACTDWMQTAGPAVTAAVRQLSARRPTAVEGSPATRATGRGGRPRRPTIPLKRIREVFEQMQNKQGHYPTDVDLARTLEVEPRTIQNYRAKGYLPLRPRDEQARPRK